MLLHYSTITASNPRATVATVGMFDGVHIGHQQVLRHLASIARREGLRPMVLTFDRHPRQVLGHIDEGFGLLCTLEERVRLIERVDDIDIVVLHFTRELADLSACQFFEQVLTTKINCRHLLLGYDNAFGSRRNNDFDSLPSRAAEQGIALTVDTPVVVDGDKVSSTRIRHALADGDMTAAAQLLGRTYTLGGIVQQGRHVGRTMGFPTANVAIADSQLKLPRDGVYAVSTQLNGRTLFGMANLGNSPTFSTDTRLLEVHLFDYSGDLYGKHLDIAFHAHLRDTRHFNTPQELQKQLTSDSNQALKILCQ